MNTIPTLTLSQRPAPATLIEAIARYEGFYVHNSRAQRNNNPGNIEFGPFAYAHGSDGLEVIPSGINDPPRFAHFPDSDTGFACLRELLTEHYGGLSLSQAMNKYAPPAENETNAYLAFVSAQTGASPAATLTPELIG